MNKEGKLVLLKS